LPAIPTIKGESFTLAPASTLLLDPTAETKTFVNKQQAVEFLTDLSMGDTPLAALAKAMDIPGLIGTQGIDTYIAAMALSLVENKFVVMLNKPRITPQPASSGGDAPAETTPDKSANLGPHEEQGLKAGTAAAATTAADKTEATPEDGQEEEPEEVPVKCQYKKLTLTCRHGNSVTLDSAKPPMEGEALPTLQIVSSQNEDLKDANGKPIFDILKLDADIENVCDAHKTNFITIGDTDAKLIGSQTNGKLAKFKSPSKKIKIGKSLLKYLWLPNVEADGVKTYKVCAVQSCDFSQFKGKGKCIRVEVFPYMKWSLKFDVNLGSISNDYIPNTTPNKMAFSGSLTLLQDNTKPDSFTLDYKNKLEVFEDTLNDFKKIIYENIFDQISEGQSLEIKADLPKIALTYDSQFKEKPGTNLVVRTHEFSFQAAPFFKVNVSVNILPFIINSLGGWWTKLLDTFFGWARQKYGDKDGIAHIEGGITLKISVEGEVGAKFSHSQDENLKITKVGEPVTSKITIKGEGEASIDGHIYVIKLKVVVKVGVESSIDVGLSLGEDVGAPYISLDFMFNGIKVYLEKEIQGKLEKQTKGFANKSNKFHRSNESDSAAEVNVKEVKRSEPRVWLNMSKKHQLKYYLVKEDRQTIQSLEEAEKERK
ncbi:MAG: hypothetical protein COB30_005365, partial [Ectothiorhodospiraceae bacterium]|nr:hypothetical protein [Ectothiorhodospiraceae bacterium]